MIALENLSVLYRTQGRDVPALSDVTLSLPAGRVTGLVGESGSGKTTLVMAILGLLPPEARVQGRILLEGVDVAGMAESGLDRFRWTRVALVPQGSQNSFNPVLSIGEQVAEPIRIHRGASRAEAEKKTRRLLDEVGLGARTAGRFPHELSGGQRQRAALAMALGCDPAFLLADEPTTALDVTIQAQILNLMKRLREDIGTSILLITHNLGVVAEMADHVAVMYAGQVVESAPVEAIFSRPAHPYTLGLLRSLPPAPTEPPVDSLQAIDGVVPSLLALPSGCRFRDRCPDAFEPCGGDPELYDLGGDHGVRCFQYRT